MKHFIETKFTVNLYSRFQQSALKEPLDSSCHVQNVIRQNSLSEKRDLDFIGAWSWIVLRKSNSIFINLKHTLKTLILYETNGISGLSKFKWKRAVIQYLIRFFKNVSKYEINFFYIYIRPARKKSMSDRTMESDPGFGRLSEKAFL